MRNFNILALACALAMIGGTAIAKDKPAEPNGEKKICKYEGSSTSRISRKRVCMTKAEWDERTVRSLENGQEDMQRIGRSN
jgi:hypothetical protein